jgi:protein-disulfide isomerase
LVEINGKKLTFADFDRKRPMAMFQAQNTYFEAQKKATEEFVDEYLLEEQAKKENLTVDQLLNREVNSKVGSAPSEEALRVYYEGVDTTEPYEAVRDKIVDALRQRRIAKLRTAYMAKLRSESTIQFRLAPPRAPISMAGTPLRGPKAAPVTVVEFADYECPYCQQIQPAIARLESEYKGKLAFAYKDFPLNIHPNAQKASEAARCAEDQGKYWEFHDKVVVNKELDVAALKRMARELKLEPQAFDKCLDSSAKADAVKAHMSEGQALGIQGTPSFFVNGRFFTGALSYETLKAIVDEELARTSAVAHATAKP